MSYLKKNSKIWKHISLLNIQASNSLSCKILLYSSLKTENNKKCNVNQTTNSRGLDKRQACKENKQDKSSIRTLKT